MILCDVVERGSQRLDVVLSIDSVDQDRVVVFAGESRLLSRLVRGLRNVPNVEAVPEEEGQRLLEILHERWPKSRLGRASVE